MLIKVNLHTIIYYDYVGAGMNLKKERKIDRGTTE